MKALCGLANPPARISEPPASPNTPVELLPSNERDPTRFVGFLYFALEAVRSRQFSVAPDLSHWDSRYLLWSLRASYSQLREVSDENGSTKGGLTCENLKRFVLARPDLNTQWGVAASLDEQTARIDLLIEKAERFIELSKERRSALITAAVTRQIDVGVTSS